MGEKNQPAKLIASKRLFTGILLKTMSIPSCFTAFTYSF